MKTMLLCSFLIASAITTPAQVLDSLHFKNSRESELYKQTLAKLENTPFNIDWKEISLRDAVADMRRQTRINFVVTRNADESDFDDVTLKLRNVSGRLVLQFLKEHGKVVFQFRHGAIFVTSTEDAIKRGAVLRFYSVHDLLYVAPDFPAPRIGINPLPPGEDAFEDVIPQEPHDPDRIIEIIKMATGADNWEFESTSIQIHRGRMIVRHTPLMQRRVRYMVAALGGL
ncbi:MAG: hypothetical protein ACI97A_003310 [Planctomycetota bacterium]|jgi:hypothetical protein